MANDTNTATTEVLGTVDGAEHTDLPPLTIPRGSDLDAVLALLEQQQTVKHDVVVTADRIRYQDGHLQVNVPAQLTEDGVTPEQDLGFAPTAIFEDQLADRLGIPVRYVRRMRSEANGDTDGLGTHLALLDRNVNHWLGEDPTRKFTVRGFHNPDTGTGIARSIHSGRYEVFDHLDVLASVLQGLAAAAEANPLLNPGDLTWKVDLTERNLRVRVNVPQVFVHAPTLLDGYRDPWNGRYGGSTGDTPPILTAGLDIRNSETGGGAVVLTPVATVLACSNGLVRKHEAIRRVHAGGEKHEGRIDYASDTQRAMLEAVRLQTRDAVGQFLTTGWLDSVVADITATATVPVALDKAQSVVEHVAKQHRLADGERDAVFALFMRGGLDNAGGIAQAITAHAHTATPTRAQELDDLALDAMATAARFAVRA